MKRELEFKDLLNEITAAVRKAILAPDISEKLAMLEQRGFHLSLVLEPTEDEHDSLLQINVMDEKRQQAPVDADMFNLTDADKDFLRTLKIKVD